MLLPFRLVYMAKENSLRVNQFYMWISTIQYVDK